MRKLLLDAMEEVIRNDRAGVGVRIRQARMDAGFTQDELADLIGVGMRQVQYYEAGDSNPYRTLHKIAEVTGRSVGWLLHGDSAQRGEADPTLASIDRRLQELAATLAEIAHAQVELGTRFDAIDASLQEGREQPQARPTRRRS